MKFSVVNLGCKVNRVETDSFAAYLMACGHELCKSSDVDLVLVNTCTVTGEAEKKTRKAVRHTCVTYPYALIVVTGCAAAIDATTYEAMSDRVIVVPKQTLLNLIEPATITLHEVMNDMRLKALWNIISGEQTDLSSLHEGLIESSAVIRSGSAFNTRVGVKVQDGCDNDCSYCIVHTARGKAYSRPWREIVAEVQALTKAGVKEIVLSGINLGSYGKQHTSSDAMHLSQLLTHLLDVSESCCESNEVLPRFRVSSIEPCDVDDDFIAVLASAQGRICRHLHLPLQSGSTKVLREMNRPYTAQDFMQLVDSLRAAVPELSLSTDVIAGFPGESEEDFQETLKVCEYCRFSKIHVFPYSQRTGTPAALRLDQVPAHLKTERAARLRALSSDLRKKDFAMRCASMEQVLVETRGRALTESYFEIEVSCDIPRGSLLSMQIPHTFVQ